MKCLVICHLEPDFESTAGCLEDLVDKVVKYSKEFDTVLNITSAEALTGTEPFTEIYYTAQEDCWREEEWIWGLDIDAYLEEEPEKWIEGKNYIPTTGHAYSEILEWMHDLNKTSQYVLVGGGRSECLQDVYEIWRHLELPIEINESLTY